MFKLNSNKKVVNRNKDIIFPELGSYSKFNRGNVKSIHLRPDDWKKLEVLRSKYKISKSAIIRIMLDNFEV